MKTIVLMPSAAKSLDRMTEPWRSRVTEAIIGYATTQVGDTKAMRGTSILRLRVGDYRVILDETATELTVLAAGHRREIYR